MKKILLTLLFLFMAGNCYSAPSNSMSITTPSSNTVVDASDETTRYNEITTKFNAHSHTDLTGTTNDFTFSGTTPTVTIGDGGAEDSKAVFDGNAQDYHIGLDDTDDSLRVGLGSALGTTDHMIFTKNGEITKPLQPCFLVRPTAAQENIATGGVTVVWGTEITDQGGDFTSNTFTAPVTGNYLLTVCLYLVQMDTDSTSVKCSIETGNRSYIQEFEPDNLNLAADGLWMYSASVVADMDATDTAYIYIDQTGGAAQMDVSTSSWFSGALLN